MQSANTPPLLSTPCRNGGSCVYKAAGRCRFVHAHVASLSSDQVHRSCQPGEPTPSFTPPSGAYSSRGSQEPLHNNRLIVYNLSPSGTDFSTIEVANVSPYEDYRTVEKTNFTVQTASSVPYLRSRPPMRLTLAGEPMGFFTVTDRSLTNASPYRTHMFVTSRFKLATR